MLSRGPHYWTDADLLFCPQSVSVGQMGMGGEAWEVSLTLLPSPSSAPTTRHMHRGPTNLLLWQKLTCPPALRPPKNNRACSPGSCVEQPTPLTRWSLNKFYAHFWEMFRSFKLWLKNCCWLKWSGDCKGKNIIPWQNGNTITLVI